MMAGIEHLDAMETTALRAAWAEAVGRPPPPHASDDYMRSVLAYRIQEEAGPKLSAATRRRLEKIATGFEGDPGYRPATTTQMKAGVRLLREWNGVTHEVNVLDSGFEYRGERHKSLSAIARAITGARWSGPRFFGLNGKEKANAA
ncbi:MAG: DUF2924 domain-containing protein [Rhodospirillales bacterium]|nr:DUF2924 domain-containing protein [Rhodospirillales bacterium]